MADGSISGNPGKAVEESEEMTWFYFSPSPSYFPSPLPHFPPSPPLEFPWSSPPPSSDSRPVLPLAFDGFQPPMENPHQFTTNSLLLLHPPPQNQQQVISPAPQHQDNVPEQCLFLIPMMADMVISEALERQLEHRILTVRFSRRGRMMVTNSHASAADSALRVALRVAVQVAVVAAVSAALSAAESAAESEAVSAAELAAESAAESAAVRAAVRAAIVAAESVAESVAESAVVSAVVAAAVPGAVLAAVPAAVPAAVQVALLADLPGGLPAALLAALRAVTSAALGAAFSCVLEYLADVKRKIQEIKNKKTRGVRITIPLEDILKYSEMSLVDAAKNLNVSRSTLKRVCRDYEILRWPPRSKFISRIPQLNSNYLQLGLSNQALSSTVVHTNQPQLSYAEKQPDTDPGTEMHLSSFKQPNDGNIVTVKARYVNGLTIKFRMSWPSSGLVELEQQVAKRLNLEAGTYHIKYKDEEDELILIACDEDFQDYVCDARLKGTSSIAVFLEPKHAAN